MSITKLIVTVALVFAAGGVTTAFLRSHSLYRITLSEFVAVGAVIVTILTPGVAYAGTKAAQAEAVSGYLEFWGSSLKAVDSRTVKCTRDGECVHTYDCDPYTAWHWVTHYRTVSDGNGGTKTESYQVWESYTAYHSCPDTTQETTYWVDDWFGERHVMGHSWFDAQPVPYRRGHSIPTNVPRGQPQQWASASRQWVAHDPEPVGKKNYYTNYLLAAYDRRASELEGAIQRYRSQGLMVEHTRNLLTEPVHHFYLVDKMQFIGGLTPVDDAQWQQALGHLNARLGTERQGDLHVVALPSNKVDDPDLYMNALLAYNQSRELGKKALGKNAILLVVGVNVQTNQVEWSRAKTGIPEGNGAMLSALGDLYRQPFEPRSLLGWPKASQNEAKLSFSPSTGAVEKIILTDYPFLRPCMDCKDAGDHGTGYVYLKSSAYISNGSQIFISITIFILAMGLFWLAAYYDMALIVNSWLGQPVRQTRRRDKVKSTPLPRLRRSQRPGDTAYESPRSYPSSNRPE